jgi:hypothetical protein
MNTSKHNTIVNLVAIVTMAFFATTAAAQVKLNNPYTIRGLQLRANLIADAPDGEVITTGPTLFQEIVPCRLTSTIEADNYPVPFGPGPFQPNESRTYRPTGIIEVGAWTNPCSQLIPRDAIAVSLRLQTYRANGNGTIYLAPMNANGTSYQPAMQYGEAADSLKEANVLLREGAFIVTSDHKTDLTIDVIGYFINDPYAQGAAGAQGEKGEKGDKGDKGDTGAMGPQGPQGERGERGEAGAQGAVGAQGPQGERGERGEAGAQGAVGPQGPQGERGERGEAGAQGAVGPQGPQGERGERGEAGAQGAVGPQGPQGERGERGEAGATGATGAQGPQGPAGAQGPAGPMGPQGPAGRDGKSAGMTISASDTLVFPPGGEITIRDSNAHANSIILLLYTEVSNGNALGVASQSNGSFVASGSPNKPFKYIIFNVE